MDPLVRKQFTTPRGLKYTYYHHRANDTKPTLVMQHGFPDNAHIYQYMIPHLLPTGYSILVPDLLGYDGTDKPTDPHAYASPLMASDLISILDYESIPLIISLGHDWGSFLAQRLYLFHPHRVAGLISLCVSYLPPSMQPYDLPAFNQQLEKETGFPRNAYWDFFLAEDAEQLLLANAEGFWSLMHPAGPNGMRDLCCVKGATRACVENNISGPLREYARDVQMKDAFVSRVRRDGLKGALNWYHATHLNIHYEAELSLLKEPKGEFRKPDGGPDLRMRRPFLFVGASEDAVCLEGYVEAVEREGLVPMLTRRRVEAGHVVQVERAEEVAEFVREWLGKEEGRWMGGEGGE